MASILLPPNVMDHIFTFLDHASLGKMAQVSNSWKRLVYRKSVWERECWDLSQQAKLTIFLNVLASGARHYGEPTSLCFLYWLMCSISSIESPLPICILRIKDHVRFVTESKKYWIEQKKPCKISNHFHVRDLLPFSYPSDFTQSDKIRLYHRLITSAISYRGCTNVYANFIQHRIVNYSWTLPSAYIDSDVSDDPYKKYLNEVRYIRNERSAHINRVLSEPLINTYNKSLRALNSCSAFEFQTNDALYKKDPVCAWEGAAFCV
jgi:hypothetical protein